VIRQNFSSRFPKTLIRRVYVATKIINLFLDQFLNRSPFLGTNFSCRIIGSAVCKMGDLLVQLSV